MDFIKKNWEKVLLGAVLVGLLFAVIGLPIKIASEKQQLEEVRNRITAGPVDSIDEVEVEGVESVLSRVQQPVTLDLNTSNRVVNPVQWNRTPSGQLIKVMKGDEVGADAVVVEDISPLYLVITLDSVLTTDSGSRYAIGVEKQAETSRRSRVKRQTYAAVGEKNETFLLREIKGPPAQPTSVDLELSDTGERITISTGKPFRRVDGYMADLTYPPDSRRWAGKRIGESVQIERENYNIVAITKTEVVLSAQSGKKTSLKFGSGS